MATAAVSSAVGDALDCVNPLIGTGSKRADEGNAGGMMPYVGAPFGMWQWVPMSRLSDHGVTSFSAYSKNFLGFVATRQPAPWMGEFGQISVMAQTGDEANCVYETRGAELVKDKCIYTPYYAKVVTKDGIVSEVTASSRAAILRFTFPKGAQRRIIFDASRFFLSCFATDRPQLGGIRFGSWFGRSTAEAWNSDRGDASETPDLKNFRARFAIEFSEPFTATGTYVGNDRHAGRKLPGEKIQWSDYPLNVQTPGASEVEADQAGGWCDFGPGDEPILVRIGSSFVSASRAEDNFRREAGDGFDFESLKAKARATWARQLSPIEIDAPDDVKTIFYTAMYHALLFPREIGEYGKYYSGIDDRVHDGDSYTCFSMWDTYRCEHAFLALAAPERVDPMMRALLQMYKEGGWLPKWPSLAYTGQMTADPAEVILAEAYAKGFRGFDAELAWEACWKSATVPQTNDVANNWKWRLPWRGYPPARCGLSRYMKNGWVAADECAESVSRTQDFCLDDLAAASLGEALGHVKEAAYLRSRAKNYRNVWNAERQYFWPRRENGNWKNGLNQDMGRGDYTECSPETAIWEVPYDMPGLMELLGGREKTIARLDNYFMNVFFKAGNPRGSMSLHENEPTHHIAYLYNLLGAHEKCAQVVRTILSTTYSTEAWGFEGNDDCGQMSSWYVLSALGFYPVLPYSGEYQIGSPLVERAVIRVGAPCKPAVFTVVAKNQSRANYVVKSVKLNGRELADRRIRHADILAGGTLEFEMAPAAKDPLDLGRNLRVAMTPEGGWNVRVEADGLRGTFAVEPPPKAAVKGERHKRLPPKSKRPVWGKECRFKAVIAQVCTVGWAVDMDSVSIRDASDGRLLERGRDYEVDPQWGGIQRLETAVIGTNTPISIDYEYRMRRIDSVVRTADGKLALRKGAPHVVTPEPPALAAGETRVGNVFVDAQTTEIGPRNLFPVSAPPPTPAVTDNPPAAKLLPRTWAKLNRGEPVTVLAWGDSVTECIYLPVKDKWQEQFVARLRKRFPKSDIRLVSNGWGGYCSNNFLSVPPDSPYHFATKVAGVKADLVISEFVNDCGQGENIVKYDYPKFLKAFRDVGSEWIIMTPHYVRPDWMGLKDCQNSDDDPRPFVQAVRKFAADNGVALADAARRWGHLWREGIPYSTLYVNDINHPIAAGMTIFADALMEVFGGEK